MKMRNKVWRRAQRTKKIKQRQKRLYEARGGISQRWWIRGPEHDGVLDKSTVYTGPHDHEDKEDKLRRKEFKSLV